MAKPTVSVIIITYGHEKFIKQAIQGVLKQDCDFEVEVIIANDHSPDQTDVIISDIIQNHPKSNWIKYTKRDLNWGMMPNFIDALRQCKGKYIAICEGDDYWTDPLKLQKQVDFLEANTGYSICFTDYNVFYENNKKHEYPKLIEKYKERNAFSRYEIILNNFIPTLTVLYRNRPDILDYLDKELFPGDWFLHVLNAKYGKIKFLPFESAVYRKHDGGVCSSSNPIFNNQRYLKSIDVFKNQFKDDYSLQFLFTVVKTKIRFQNLKIRLKDILYKE